jgi:magnesium-transporting ATPase (P-type)
MVARDVQNETRESPLKLRLTRLASTISKIGYFMAALVALAYFFNVIVVDGNFSPDGIKAIVTDGRGMVSHLIHALTLMITVVVVSTPEGLPMMITVVLSANMKKMIRDKVLVKKLVGIETAGSLNILFTDKTGTITEGILSCDKVITSNGEYKTALALKREGSVYEVLKKCALYNTESKITDEGVKGGNSTEKALAEFFIDEALKPVKIKSKIPFDSDKKYSSVELSDGTVITKGAPEVILNRVNYMLTADGDRVSCDLEYVRHKYLDSVSRGERVICISEKKPYESEAFVALVVLKDKIRSDVKKAVRQVQKAGIQVVMVTGDSKETASAIAEECGSIKLIKVTFP